MHGWWARVPAGVRGALEHGDIRLTAGSPRSGAPKAMDPVMGRYGWIASYLWALSILLAGLWGGIAFADWVHSLPAVAVPVQADAGPPASVERTGWDLFAFILRRNMTVYVLLLFGLASAGLASVVVLFGNGIALGQVIGFAKLSGVPAGALANLLLPHGVLELGALCVAGAVGLQGLRLARGLSTFNWGSIRALRLGPVMVFGLAALSVAAGVEAFVTADIAESTRTRSWP